MIGEVLSPKLWGGHPCTPVRQRFTREAKLKDVSQIAKRIGTLHRPTTADVLVVRPSPVKMRFFDFKYDVALCCHGKTRRSPSEVVMLPEVLPWSADGSPRDVGESGSWPWRVPARISPRLRVQRRVES